MLQVAFRRFGDYSAVGDTVSWAVTEGDASVVRLQPIGKGASCEM